MLINVVMEKVAVAGLHFAAKGIECPCLSNCLLVFGGFSCRCVDAVLCVVSGAPIGVKMFPDDCSDS